jgi:outer membrane protein OmpA-like peptidoglycan-associated protein
MRTKSSPADGKYALVLSAGRNYNLEFKSDGYSSYTATYDLRSTKEYQEYNLDIELFTSAKLTLTVSDFELFEALEANVNVKIQGESSLIQEVKTSKSDGRVILDLPLGQVYEVFITATYFKGASFSFDLTGFVVYRNYERDLSLEPEKVRIFLDVADIKNNGKIRSKIIIRNKSRNEVIEAHGNEYVALRAGDRYEIESTSSNGYAFNSTTIDLTSKDATTQAANVNVGMKLTKLEKDAKLELKNINFESNSVQLSEGSYQELLRVVKLMEENPTLKVEIAAHTDDIGASEYNRILSDRRAQSVVEYLIDNRITSSKFQAKGYGESEPLATNDSDENRAKNRRVELKVLSIE